MTVAVWGEPVALSATETLALRPVVAVAGVKVTVTVHVAAAASDAPQLLVCEKLLALVPVMEMLVIVRAAVPEFDNVIGIVAAELPTFVFGKVSGFGLRAAAGAEAETPVPLTVMLKDWAGPPPLLVAESPIAVFVYTVGVVGEKVTLRLQLAPGARAVVQVPAATVKGAEPLTGLMVALYNSPLLVNVMVCAALVVPIVCWAKVRLPGVAVKRGRLPCSRTVPRSWLP
jgi:hypothetical protein